MKRSTILFLVSAILCVAYFIVTDPDARIITDLSYGFELIFTLRIVVVSMLMCSLYSLIRLILISPENKEKEQLDAHVQNTPESVGQIMIAKSIVSLSYALIVAAVSAAYILGLSGN